MFYLRDTITCDVEDTGEGSGSRGHVPRFPERVPQVVVLAATTGGVLVQEAKYLEGNVNVRVEGSSDPNETKHTRTHKPPAGGGRTKRPGRLRNQ